MLTPVYALVMVLNFSRVLYVEFTIVDGVAGVGQLSSECLRVPGIATLVDSTQRGNG